VANVICKPEDVVKGAKELINLLSEEKLKEREVPPELLGEAQNLRRFLKAVLKNLKKKPRDYGELLKLLSKVNVDDELSKFLPFKGSLIEALSVLSLPARKQALAHVLNVSLERTGTLDDDAFRELREKYERELTEAVATFYALKTIGNELGINPFKNLRQNVGNRSVEEYFSDLVAGWTYEDYVVKKLTEVCKDENVNVEVTGTDKARKIKFSNVTGESDVTLFKEGRGEAKLRLEVQRVGRSSVKSNIKSNKKSNKDGCKKEGKFELKFELKKHKVEKSDYLILIIGKNVQEFLKELGLEGKLLLIPSPKGEKEEVPLGTVNVTYENGHLVLSWPVSKDDATCLDAGKSDLQRITYALEDEGFSQLCARLTQLLDDRSPSEDT